MSQAYVWTVRLVFQDGKTETTKRAYVRAYDCSGALAGALAQLKVDECSVVDVAMLRQGRVE
jgi:hypothetical protein